MNNETEKLILLVNGAAGAYIPQWFTEQYFHLVSNADKFEEEKQILLNGPDNEEYWDAWEDVLYNAEILIDGNKYHLEQEDDLWAILDGLTFEDLAE